MCARSARNYAGLLEDALATIAEDNPEKRDRLAAMLEAQRRGEEPRALLEQRRWIGAPRPGEA